MHPMKNDTAAVGYNAAYSTSEPRFSLSNAIALHARLERSCDALIQKQDDMIRAVALRCRSDAPEKHAPVSLTPLNSADDRPGANSQSGRCESIDRDAFAPLATPEFILQASKEEAESIETCEFEITLLRQHMR